MRNLSTFSKFEKDNYINRMSYVLMLLERNEDNTVEHPMVVKGLLLEFHDVIPKEILLGLPPLQHI